MPRETPQLRAKGADRLAVALAVRAAAAEHRKGRPLAFTWDRPLTPRPEREQS